MTTMIKNSCAASQQTQIQVFSEGTAIPLGHDATMLSSRKHNKKKMTTMAMMMMM